MRVLGIAVGIVIGIIAAVVFRADVFEQTLSCSSNPAQQQDLQRAIQKNHEVTNDVKIVRINHDTDNKLNNPDVLRLQCNREIQNSAKRFGKVYAEAAQISRKLEQLKSTIKRKAAEIKMLDQRTIKLFRAYKAGQTVVNGQSFDSLKSLKAIIVKLRRYRPKVVKYLDNLKRTANQHNRALAKLQSAMERSKEAIYDYRLRLQNIDNRLQLVNIHSVIEGLHTTLKNPNKSALVRFEQLVTEQESKLQIEAPSEIEAIAQDVMDQANDEAVLAELEKELNQNK